MDGDEGELVGVPGELADEVELVDALLKPLADRPVDMTDPDWTVRLGEGPHPLDEAGVREEAETALRRLLVLYERGDEQTRSAVREPLNRCGSFRRATHVPGLCEEACAARIDIRPLLLEVAELSSAEAKYGMGSVQEILRRAAGRDPAGLW
ncbi:hypothetical protein [Streptomyces sp. NPDC088350]|uniref:hypothetical protein n=1 Tax=Streptomyces sp. NPDC088350 TaxID=3365854 RepID=UPI00381AB46E